MAARKSKNKLLTYPVIIISICLVLLLIMLNKLANSNPLERRDIYFTMIMIIAFPVYALARSQVFRPERDKSKVLFQLNSIKSAIIFLTVFAVLMALGFISYLYFFGFYN